MNKHEAANLLANWWAKQITKGDLDNGDNSFTGMTVKMMATKLQEEGRKTIDPQKLEKFLKRLYDNLKTQPGRQIVVSVDYHPNYILANALEIAGIDESVCPAKTASYIEQVGNDWEVWVSAGYQKPWEKITVL